MRHAAKSAGKSERHPCASRWVPCAFMTNLNSDHSISNLIGDSDTGERATNLAAQLGLDRRSSVGQLTFRKDRWLNIRRSSKEV
jgi:hypothetical protein